MQLVSSLKGAEGSQSDIILAKKGDKNAFGRLIEQHKVSMYRIALSMLGNKQDVEDAIQNAIISAYRGISQLKKAEYFKTWLIRILINECTVILRNNKRIIPFEDIKPDTTAPDDFSKIELTNAVNSLDQDLRVVTTLFYFEDVPQKDIAKLLNIPEGTVRSRLSRARIKLFEILKEI